MVGLPDVGRGAHGSFSSLRNLNLLHLQGRKTDVREGGREGKKRAENPFRNGQLRIAITKIFFKEVAGPTPDIIQQQGLLYSCFSDRVKFFKLQVKTGLYFKHGNAPYSAP